MKYARLLALVGVALATRASAHLMVAQHGTVNVVGNGAFLVLSVPAAAFPFADEDGDGRLSPLELQRHQSDVGAAVQAGARLLEGDTARPLEGMLFSLTPDELAPAEVGAQLVVLGRFALATPGEPLRFELTLFGGADQSEQMTFTRGAESQLARFTPTRTTSALFPSSGALFIEYLHMGVEHIVTGFDHLLFLLVVLAAGGGWRRVALGLTCFTLGHAATLALSVVGGVSAPSSLVEPAIALTIIGMAAFDARARARGVESSGVWRLGLVFACALIHGLGLASSLTSLGVDRAHLLSVLGGFNLGVEVGQLAVSAVAALVVVALARFWSKSTTAHAQRWAGVAAMLIGSVWLVQRVW